MSATPLNAILRFRNYLKGQGLSPGTQHAGQIAPNHLIRKSSNNLNLSINRHLQGTLEPRNNAYQGTLRPLSTPQATKRPLDQ